MNRVEKYKLQRSLIELENIVEALVNYVNIRNTMDFMFNDPIAVIDSYFGTRRDYDSRRTDGIRNS